MTSAAEKLLEQALTLPEHDRAAMASALERSIARGAEDLSSEWKAELTRRILAVERGESTLIPGDQIEARIRDTLAKH